MLRIICKLYISFYVSYLVSSRNGSEMWNFIFVYSDSKIQSLRTANSCHSNLGYPRMYSNESDKHSDICIIGKHFNLMEIQLLHWSYHISRSQIIFSFPIETGSGRVFSTWIRCKWATGVCGRRRGTGKDFTLSTSVFPCHIIPPMKNIYLSKMIYINCNWQHS